MGSIPALDTTIRLRSGSPSDARPGHEARSRPGAAGATAGIGAARYAGLAVRVGSWTCFLGGAAFLVLAFSYGDVIRDLDTARAMIDRRDEEGIAGIAQRIQHMDMLARMAAMLRDWLVVSGTAAGSGFALWVLGCRVVGRIDRWGR